jgi:ribosome-associated protein
MMVNQIGTASGENFRVGSMRPRSRSRLRYLGVMIRITNTVSLDPRDIEENFVRASGPGGQNVNKVSTAVQLRFNLAAAVLPDGVRARLRRLAGNRVTLDGVLLINVQRHRTQERNRAEAQALLVDLVRQATVRPVRRVATRPTLASKRRRVDAKTLRGAIKRGRSAPDGDG